MKYRAYGLVVESEIAIPELAPSTGVPTAQIRFGDTPERLPSCVAVGGWWEAARSTVLVTIPNIGRFLIRDGTEILVTPFGNPPAPELAFALVHAAVGPLLHQRDTLLLHASAVQLPGMTVALAGHSGIGKSTLLYECVRRGGRMIADDVAALEIGECDSVRIHRGGSVIQLWRDTLNHYGVATDQLTQIRSMLKFQLPAVAALSDEPLPLTAIGIIEAHPHGEITCTRLGGQAAFRFLRTHTRGRRIAEALDRPGTFQRLAQVADRVPVFRIQRPDRDVRSIAALADQVLALAGQ